VALLRSELSAKFYLATSLLQVLVLLSNVFFMDIPSLLVKTVIEIFFHVLAIVLIPGLSLFWLLKVVVVNVRHLLLRVNSAENIG